MTPLERKKTQELQRRLIAEIQLADQLYEALVQGGFDNIWWSMQDYAAARGKKGIQPPKFKSKKFIRRMDEGKMQGWRMLNCEDFTVEQPKEDDDQ